MAASIALAAVAMVATATAAYATDGRAEPAMTANRGVAVMVAPREELCRVVVDLTNPASGTWAAPRNAPVASAVVFGVARAQVDPVCLALAFRDGRGWGALMSVAEVIWRATVMPPWSDSWNVKMRGSACAAL